MLFFCPLCRVSRFQKKWPSYHRTFPLSPKNLYDQILAECGLKQSNYWLVKCVERSAPTADVLIIFTHIFLPADIQITKWQKLSSAGAQSIDRPLYVNMMCLHEGGMGGTLKIFESVPVLYMLRSRCLSLSEYYFIKSNKSPNKALVVVFVPSASSKNIYEGRIVFMHKSSWLIWSRCYTCEEYWTKAILISIVLLVYY